MISTEPDLTSEQEARRERLVRERVRPDDEVRAFQVPEGSVLIVRSDKRGKPNWFEITEPTPTFQLCWDISDW